MLDDGETIGDARPLPPGLMLYCDVRGGFVVARRSSGAGARFVVRGVDVLWCVLLRRVRVLLGWSSVHVVLVRVGMVGHSRHLVNGLLDEDVVHDGPR